MHMLIRNAFVVLAAMVLSCLPACGDSASQAPDSGTKPTDGREAGVTSDSGGAADTGTAGDTAPMEDAGGAGDTGSDPDGGLGDATAGCSVWEITYDLTGSEFEISNTPFGAGDQVNTVATPYDADDHVGPGAMVIRFQDVGGTPGGLAAIYSYTMAMHFVVSGVTTVATDLDATAGPDACGVTTGALNGTTVAWSPSALVGHHAVGQILCTGALCSFGGLPNGQPQPHDETVDQPLSDFVFAASLSSFSMAETTIAQDSKSTTSWAYEGTETGRQLVTAPACLCP